MRRLLVEPVDPYDDDAVAAWHHVYAEAERFGREDVATVWQLEEMRVMLQDAGSRLAVRAWNGRMGGDVVAAGYVRMPLQDNLDRAEVAVHVLPEQRRLGLGRSMAERLEQEARGLGRATLYAEVQWDFEGGSDGAGRAGSEFARAAGYDLALSDVQRELALPVADDVLSTLAERAAPQHEAYELRSFVGAVPDDLVAGWTVLIGSLSTEAPTGDLDLEPEAISVADHREAEEVVRRQGRTKYNTVALDRAGEVVAYTDLATTVHEPGRAYQWGTLVRRADRGHSLGLAVKAANLRLLQQERPDIERVFTWNAESNSHMVAVNEQLGFRPVGRLGEFQKRLTPLP
jgi:RimJ/RimL family protein N-acetyltransferase